MAIENWINISGTFKKISDQCINVSGTFKKVTEKWINISGVWKKVYNSVTGSFPVDWTTLFNKTINNFYFAGSNKIITVSPSSGTVDVVLSGSRATAKKNAGLYEAGPWTAVDGDTFQIRLQASASASSAVTGTLTITQGGDTISWTIWTT